MPTELRNSFEKRLKQFLSDKFIEIKGFKILKNEISIKLDKGCGRIGFRFLNNAQGYSLSESENVPDIKNFYEKINPPYKPSFSTDFELVMNTSMESRYRQFSPRGVIELPRNEDEQLKACEYIYNKLNEIYVPRVLNLINAHKDVIDDVLLFPNYYKYPFLTILYVLTKNVSAIEDFNLDEILSKRILGNKSFDEALFYETMMVHEAAIDRSNKGFTGMACMKSKLI